MFKRQQVVEEALSWVGTPYRHMGKIKGAGVDCAFLLLRVFESCGVIKPMDVGKYPQDFHLHQRDSRYLKHVESVCVKLPEGQIPEPGDIALFQYGRCIAHGGIVTEYPRMIHSYLDQGVIISDIEADPDLRKRLRGFWTPFKES